MQLTLERKREIEREAKELSGENNNFNFIGNKVVYNTGWYLYIKDVLTKEEKDEVDHRFELEHNSTWLACALHFIKQ